MLLNKYVNKRTTLFLDIGANLGIHTLYAAKMGFKTWAVEPQQRNLIKVNHSDTQIHYQFKRRTILFLKEEFTY